MSFGKASRSAPPPCFSTLSLARFRRSSSFHPCFATPMTGTDEDTAPDHPLERREDLLEGEVARRPVEDECVGRRTAHDFFSSWPPKACRMAERTLSA